MCNRCYSPMKVNFRFSCTPYLRRQRFLSFSRTKRSAEAVGGNGKREATKESLASKNVEGGGVHCNRAYENGGRCDFNCMNSRAISNRYATVRSGSCVVHDRHRRHRMVTQYFPICYVYLSIFYSTTIHVQAINLVRPGLNI